MLPLQKGLRKIDLSVTTEEIGGMVKSNIDTIPSVTLLRAVRPSDRKRKAGGTVTLSAAPVVKHAKLISSPLSKTTLVKQEIVDNDADNDGDNDDDYTGEMDTDLDDHSYLGSAVSKSASQTTESEKADSSSAVTVRVNLDGTEAVDEIIQPEPPESQTGHLTKDSNSQTEQETEADTQSDHDQSLYMDHFEDMFTKKRDPVTGIHTFTCKECGITSKRKNNITRHLRSHLPDQIRCSACNIFFSTEDEKFKHMDLKHSELVVCHVCGRKFKRTTELKRHLVTHGIKCESVKEFRCPIEGCDKVFFRKALYEYHLNKHSGKKPFTCDLCHQSYHNEFSMRYHRKMCQVSTTYQCPECDAEFKRKASLDDHHQAFHTQVTFTCECGSAFKYKSGLNRHLRTAHRDMLEPQQTESAVTVKQEESSEENKASDDRQMNIVLIRAVTVPADDSVNKTVLQGPDSQNMDARNIANSNRDMSDGADTVSSCSTPLELKTICSVAEMNSEAKLIETADTFGTFQQDRNLEMSGSSPNMFTAVAVTSLPFTPCNIDDHTVSLPQMVNIPYTLQFRSSLMGYDANADQANQNMSSFLGQDYVPVESIHDTENPDLPSSFASVNEVSRVLEQAENSEMDS
ncbi:zinc finger protein 184-like isoform X2 [Mya arenaria]|uniref:zinc finger protein 184-like isoform X2 n=1 Tax=Mya arenaria TaxID=6604 RepID=UPI0022E77CDF|nr:zinc finger protein 184-like isoform X2 [Mya arenaria]